MAVVWWSAVSMKDNFTRLVISCLLTLFFFFLFFFFWHVADNPPCLWQWIFWSLWTVEPIVKNGRPPTSHSMHSFLHQYTGSFKKPPLRRPHSVIGGSLGSFMAMPRNGSRLGNFPHCLFQLILLCKIMLVLICSKRYRYSNALINLWVCSIFFWSSRSLFLRHWMCLQIFTKKAIRRTHRNHLWIFYKFKSYKNNKIFFINTLQGASTMNIIWKNRG